MTGAAEAELWAHAQHARQRGDANEAARLCGEVLRARPDHAGALYILGALHFERGGFAQAERLLGQAVKNDARSADAAFAHGMALLRLARAEEAAAAFAHALGCDPRHAGALVQRGNICLAAGRESEAVSFYARALEIDAANAEAWHNRGVALSRLSHLPQAIACFDTTLALRPDSVDTWFNRGNAHFAVKNFTAAAADFEQALARDPAANYARGQLLLARMSVCDWRGWAETHTRVLADMREGRRAIEPFGNLMVSRSPAEQRECARVYAARFPCPAPLWTGERYHHGRIRVAYVSGDFRTHPVSVLLAGVLEHHDRALFEMTALSFGPDDGSPLRARVKNACDRFIDMREASDTGIAAALRAHEIDIAVDLMGYTADCRPGIFALRPAPVQVNYLGFPATTAAGAMDYIIADAVTVPSAEMQFYSERVVHLPETYLPTDGARPVSAEPGRRAHHGLPEAGFVFCSFNMPYKITPDMFASWMRLVAAVPDSVLWLPDMSAQGGENLRREASTRGVAPERLVFAPFLENPADHLARLSLADLFLDTLPCNAHTTAADALWAGLPVLTCAGSTFAGRVAASALHALDMPELIAETLAAYEEAALAFARAPAMLTRLREKLARNLRRAPLFDTARYTRHLERAYAAMHARQERGEAPDHFAVGRMA